MPKNMKVCRVCGKTYESCRSIKTGSAVFNWREMCCSPECGAVYLQCVNESRSGFNKAKEKTKEKKNHSRKNEWTAETVSQPTEEQAETKEDTPDVSCVEMTS